MLCVKPSRWQSPWVAVTCQNNQEAASEGGQDQAMSQGAGGGGGGGEESQGGLVDAQREVRKPPLGPGRAVGRW